MVGMVSVEAYGAPAAVRLAQVLLLGNALAIRHRVGIAKQSRRLIARAAHAARDADLGDGVGHWIEIPAETDGAGAAIWRSRMKLVQLVTLELLDL